MTPPTTTVGAADARLCPREADPELLTCPRGCGFVTLAKPSLRWGPWRMQVHLLNPSCPPPIPGVQGTYGPGGFRPAATR